MKTPWLIRRVVRIRRYRVAPTTARDRKKYEEHKEAAYELVKKRVDYFCTLSDFRYRKITIKNQKTRWGSCSRKGNLNFNYRILFLPEAAQDYVIVHELCHLAVFNHSKKFWEHVAELIPNHREVRKSLRGFSLL